MQFVIFFVLLLGCVKAWHAEKNIKYAYPTAYSYEQLLDHFNPTIDKTFHQRYFLSEEYWSKGEGPIFFYTGNEGDITSFINNTGFMWDIAPVFQALVVFAEHRYYGKSKPYGDIQPSVNTTDKFAQLTAEQALADYAELITYLKKERHADNCSVIAFGGSYGGMLSAWMRLKYSHIVDGAIAASAPVNNFQHHTNCDGYNRVFTNDFLTTKHGDQCVANIRNAWPLIDKTAQIPGGLNKLSKIFQTCKPLESGDELINWLVGCWGNMVMVDYPYPANFLAPLPAWPVNVTCEHLATPLQGDELLAALFKAISVYANYTGSTDCFDMNVVATAAISNTLWDYQACTQMVMPSCSTGVSDMFLPSKWDYESYAQTCKEMYGVTPRPDWIELNFGGDKYSYASNIVFSNGVLDPWHPGGVLQNKSNSVIAFVMWGAAHHLDLRHHHESDPLSVKQGRETEMLFITKWIAEKYQKIYRKFV